MHRKKETYDNKSSSLVAIVKRVVASNAKGISSRKLGKTCVIVIGEYVSRSGQGRLEQPLIAQTI